MLENLFSFLKPKRSGPRQIKPVMLVIMDGWGIAPPSRGNVEAQAKTPNLKKLMSSFPNTQLIASGESVGLPANEVGNTEVGHLTLGTGRVIYQGLKRINVAIEDSSFLRNKALQGAIDHVVKHHSKLHLMGVLSTGNVHASLPHFYALLQLCKRAGLENVCVHGFTDGRDSPPKEALEIFTEVEKRLNEAKLGHICSVSGRYYAMDRDRRWERIQVAYNAIVEGKGLTATTFEEAIQNGYKKGLTDEQIEPTVIVKNDLPLGTIDDNDAVIFFNFRIDRPRELTMALTMPNFEEFDAAEFGYSNQSGVKETTFTRTKVAKNLYVVSMTNYHQNIPVNAVAFDTDIALNPLGQVIAEHNLKQLHLAESEKERFVGFYFDGYHEAPFPGEDRLVVPSPKVATYDRRPQMSVFQTVKEFQHNLDLDQYHFFVMNIANPDMVAHTGNIAATVKACEATDKAIGEIMKAIFECDGTLFVTADHGNAEELLTYPTSSFFFTSSQGTMNTDHSNNPVPFIIANKKLEGVKVNLSQGSLSDVAPTILAFMGLPIPSQMTGKNLLQ